MEEERNLGVTDTRFALTILMCALVALGYIALLRLGAPKDSAGDSDPVDSSPAIAVSPPLPKPSDTEPAPQVLPLDDRTAKRPPQPSNRNSPTDSPVPVERR